MFPIPKSVKGFKSFLKQPVAWFFLVLVIFQLGTYPFQLQTEKGIEGRKDLFYEWWEEEGKFHYAAMGEIPNEEKYREQELSYIHEYTSSKLRYALNLQPMYFSPSNLLTAWWLHPGLLSLFAFIFAFPYLGLWLSARWGSAKTLGLCAAAGTASMILYYGWTYLMESKLLVPMTGTSGIISFLFGMYLMLHHKKKTNWVYFSFANKKWDSLPLPFGFFFFCWLILDISANWVVNDSIYRSHWLLNLFLMGAGALVANKGDVSQKRIAPVKAAAPKKLTEAERNQHGKNLIAQGWELFEKFEMDGSWRTFKTGFTILFQKPEENRDFIEKHVEKLFGEKLQLPIQAMELYEFGLSVKDIGLTRCSMMILSRVLKENPPKMILRHTQYTMAENLMQMKEGLEQAQKLLEDVAQEEDAMGRKARALLSLHFGGL
jgi:membrane associated rhomboid family serine protease